MEFEVNVLDGGQGTELQKIGHHIDSDILWSARLLFSDPDSVVRVHENFAKSGTTVATTMTYQASVDGFMKEFGVDSSEAMSLISSSVQLARNGFVSVEKSMKVAGSIGPYGACLGDLSEYTGNYIEKMSIEELMDWHRPRIKALVDAGCDLLAFETIPACDEGKALVNLLKEFPDMKAWLSFSCQTVDSLCHGEKFSSSIYECLQFDVNKQLVAVGVNCCDPSFVCPLLTSSLKLLPPYCSHIAYPNGASKNDSVDTFHNFQSLPFVKLIEDLKVRWIGGCCFTSPNDIKCMVDVLKQSENILI
ncbi:Homocysteine S-methyltransferase YbgG [Nymphon striatum]|nr:Homocysteine S-methyltransferase YbgG [Nymphon striatum]